MASEIRLTQPQTLSILSCKNCGKTDVKLQKCGRCHFERYCGQPCQIAHWPKHKQVCQLKKTASQVELPFENHNSKDLIDNLSTSKIEGYKKDLERARLTRNSDEIGYASAQLGYIYESLGQFNESLEYYLESLKAAKQANILMVQGETCLSIGRVFDSLGRYEEAYKYYRDGLVVAKGDEEIEQKLYGSLALICESLMKYKEMADCFENYLKFAKNRDEKRRAYLGLGLAYEGLGDYSKSVVSYKTSLEFTSPETLSLRAGIYLKLGAAYQLSGENSEARKCLQQSLDLSQRDPEAQSDALTQMGIVEDCEQNYKEAIECYEKGLVLTSQSEKRGIIYTNLGGTYFHLNECQKAIDFFQKSLKFLPKKSKYEANTYINLGLAFEFLGESQKAIEYCNQGAQILNEMGNLRERGISNAALSSIQLSLGQHESAISSALVALQAARNAKNPLGEVMAQSNLANIYSSQLNYSKSIEHHKAALKIAEEIKNFEARGQVHCNLGLVYERMNMLKEAEQHLRTSIDCYFHYQDKIKDNYQWKITSFEKEILAYNRLERLLTKQNRFNEALVVTDSKRSRALVYALLKKIDPKKDAPSLALMDIQKIQLLAQKWQTTFVCYSIASLEELNSILPPNLSKFIYKLRAYIISSEGDIKCKDLELDGLSSKMKNVDEIGNSFPFLIPTELEGDDWEESFNKRLSLWYEALILPIEDGLPKDSKQTVTIIADGFLSLIPFAALRSKKGKYLIEKHPISIAPSIKVLELLDQLPKVTTGDSLIVGNPTTPNPHDNDLGFAEAQTDIVKDLLDTPKNKVLLKSVPTVSRVIKEVADARWIHLSSHGTLGNTTQEKSDPYSVFEGLFKLVADVSHPRGYLQSQEIAFLNLKADLVFMSACFSGRGKIQREGTVGPVWSFLAAGARSTIGTYWGLLDTELTNQMVEIFYKHLLGKGVEKLNKAQALQKAMLQGIKKDRNNPRQWAAFFLSGLTD